MVTITYTKRDKVISWTMRYLKTLQEHSHNHWLKPRPSISRISQKAIKSLIQDTITLIPAETRPRWASCNHRTIPKGIQSSHKHWYNQTKTLLRMLIKKSQVLRLFHPWKGRRGEEGIQQGTVAIIFIVIQYHLFRK